MIDKERLRIFLEPPNQRSGQVRDLPYNGKQFLSKNSKDVCLASGIVACSLREGDTEAWQLGLDLLPGGGSGRLAGIGLVTGNRPLKTGGKKLDRARFEFAIKLEGVDAGVG
jgi:hypothetical protein